MSWAIDDLLVEDMPGEGLRITFRCKFDGAPVFHGKPIEINLANSLVLLMNDLVMAAWDTKPPTGKWLDVLLHRGDNGKLTALSVEVPPPRPPGTPVYTGIG